MIGMTVLGFGLGVGVGWLVHHFWWSRSQRQQPSASTESNDQAGELVVLRKQLQQTELAYYMAVEMSQLKGNFLARTAHELRSPMNGIIGMHQLILENLTDSPQEEREFIAQANASALRMVQVLDEVIDAAKVAQGTTQLQLQPVALVRVLQEVQRLTHLQAQNRNLRLTVQFPEDDRYVIADPLRLRQVLVSLVDAAIAQLHEGEITLTVVPGAEADVIQLESPVAAETWSLDLTQPPTRIDDDAVRILDKQEILQVANRAFPEPGFVFAVARSLMVSMQGDLELVTVADQPGITQIRGTIPGVGEEASVD